MPLQAYCGDKKLSVIPTDYTLSTFIRDYLRVRPKMSTNGQPIPGTEGHITFVSTAVLKQSLQIQRPSSMPVIYLGYHQSMCRWCRQPNMETARSPRPHPPQPAW